MKRFDFLGFYQQYKKQILIGAACLVAVVLIILIIALSGGNKGSGKKAPELPPKELIYTSPSALRIRVGASGPYLSVAFDNKGNVTALVAEQGDINETIVTNCADIIGKPGSDAVQQILTVVRDNDLMIDQNYVLLSLRNNSDLPNDSFLPTIAADAEALLEGIPVILATNADMDADGYYNVDIARQLLKAFLGEDIVITAESIMIDGCYTFTCKEGADYIDYVVSAFNGSVAPYYDIVTEPSPEEEDMIPGDQQFEIVDEPVLETEEQTEIP